MAAVAVYDWRTRQWVEQAGADRRAVAQGVAVAHVALVPAKALASAAVTVDPTGFVQVLNAALQIADWLCVGVIMFSGASWMFGDRTRALQHMLGAAVGYLLIRKAVIIRDFLRAL